jgi:hypothetical protein
MARKRLGTVAGAAEEHLKSGGKKVRARLVGVERAADKLAKKVKARRRRVRRHVPGAAPRAPETIGTAPSSGMSANPSGAPVSADASVSPGPTLGAGAPVSADAAVGVGTDPVSQGAESVPDDSWTVAALRAEARRRGMTGYSRKTKAQLVAELRG